MEVSLVKRDVRPIRIFLEIHVSALSSLSQTVPNYKFDLKQHYRGHRMDAPLESFDLNGRN